MSTLVLNAPLQPKIHAAPPPAAPPASPAPAVPWILTQGAWQPHRTRRWGAVLTLAVHGLGALALLQAERTAVAQLQPAPVELSLLAERALTPTPAPVPKPSAPLQPAPVVAVVPVPEFEATATARTITAVAPTTPSPEAVATPAAQHPGVATAAATPSPKPVAASALRYRVEPAVEVPLLSRRAGEHGRVALRVVFDAQGRPRDIQLQRGSGFARLDAQALEAMKAARITPIVEDGRAIEVLATAWLEYELD